VKDGVALRLHPATRFSLSPHHKKSGVYETVDALISLGSVGNRA